MILGLVGLLILAWITFKMFSSAGEAAGTAVESVTAVASNHREKEKIRKIQSGLNRLYQRADWVVVDTETSGLGATAVAVEIAVVDHQGQVLMDSRIAIPKGRRISPEATQVHGITSADLKDAPKWPELREKFLALTEGKRIVAYNSDFDERIVRQTDEAHSLDTPPREWLCLMGSYSKMMGEVWTDSGRSKYQKLPGAGHTAREDALAAYALLRKIAMTAPP